MYRLQNPLAAHIATVAATAKLMTVYVFAIALILQTFHITEHLAQVYQHAVIGLSIPQSHGILFFLDFEWNHFIFNSVYFIVLGVIFIQCRFFDGHGPAGEKRLASLAFTAGFLIQGYHVIEHSVRMTQFYQTGCTPCAGILGRFFDGVYLHFTLNAAVYILPLIAFLAYGFHLRLKYPLTGYRRLSDIPQTEDLNVRSGRKGSVKSSRSPGSYRATRVLKADQAGSRRTFLKQGVLLGGGLASGFLLADVYTQGFVPATFGDKRLFFGSGVNRKTLPDPKGNLTATMDELFSVGPSFVSCMAPDNPSPFLFDTKSYGKMTIDSHSFSMIMVSSKVDTVTYGKSEDGSPMVRMSGRLDCATQASSSGVKVGNISSYEGADYEAEMVDRGPLNTGKDSFSITAFFDSGEDPINYSIFGDKATFTGEMIHGDIVITRLGDIEWALG